MVELGKYAGTVLSAYGVTLVLIAVLVAQSLIRGAQVRRALDEMEKRRGRADG